MLYIEPGSPRENGFAASFFSRLRDELLNCEEFANLAQARWFARRRREEQNHERPHSTQDYQTPWAFAPACAAFASATLASSSTREVKKSKKKSWYPFPNPYSHNFWTKNRKQISSATYVHQFAGPKTRPSLRLSDPENVFDASTEWDFGAAVSL